MSPSSIVACIRTATSTLTIYDDGCKIFVDNDGNNRVRDSKGEDVPIASLYKTPAKQQPVPSKYQRLETRQEHLQRLRRKAAKESNNRAHSTTATPNDIKPKPGDTNYSYISQDPAYSRRWDREAPAATENGVFTSVVRYQALAQKRVKRNIDSRKISTTKDKTPTTELPSSKTSTVDNKRKRYDDTSSAAEYQSPPISSDGDDDERSTTKKAKFDA